MRGKQFQSSKAVEVATEIPREVRREEEHPDSTVSFVMEVKRADGDGVQREDHFP